MSLKYEPASEPLHISAKYGFAYDRPASVTEMHHPLRPSARVRHTPADIEGLVSKDVGTRPDPKTVSGDETYPKDGQLRDETYP